MRPSGPASSVFSTVGRCVAMRPSLPLVTSVANGRARISACASTVSSTLNSAGVYIDPPHSLSSYFTGRGDSTCRLDPLQRRLQLGERRLEGGAALAVLLDHLRRRLGDEARVRQLGVDLLDFALRLVDLAGEARPLGAHVDDAGER